MIEGIKHFAHLREYVASIFAPLVAGISYDVELYEEKFFELQSYSGAFQFLGLLRIMHNAKCLVATHKMKGLSHEFWQGLR